MKRKPLTRFAWLSVAAALLTMGLKAYAYHVTGSVGLLSDAAESLVNLAAALVAWMVLSIAARPADTGHPFGHGKIEYFASGFEGSLILVAAGGIAWAAWDRLQAPVTLQAIDLGLAVSVVAGLVNLMVGMILIRAGRRHGSITLEADGRHLLTDVWTTAAILLALLGVLYTGWWWLDPVIALLAAIQIVWSGLQLIRRSVDGLLDTVLPQPEQRRIQSILDEYRRQGIEFHDLRTRQSGMDRFVNLHVLVPGGWTVRQGHDLVEEIEQSIAAALGNASVVTHL
ncbi:MAG: cation transporter, partial [Methylococcus sp.]